LTETNFQILLPSPLHTHLLGVQIAKTAPSKLAIALNGPLGAGKTSMVQGIAEGLGIKEKVNSPTFTLINEYHSGSKPLYHVDLYRLNPGNTDNKDNARDNANDANNTAALILELNEIFEQQAVVAVEWAELLQSYLPPDCLQITLSYVKDGTARQARLKGAGAEIITQNLNKLLQNDQISSHS
jgi:tRNA threonylcarbamoyladenosine biosynthesis protein TsaE